MNERNVALMGFESNQIKRLFMELNSATGRKWIIFIKTENCDVRIKAVSGYYEVMSPVLDVRDLGTSDDFIDSFAAHVARYIQCVPEEIVKQARDKHD